jgi:hypothetical protein
MTKNMNFFVWPLHKSQKTTKQSNMLSQKKFFFVSGFESNFSMSTVTIRFVP